MTEIHSIDDLKLQAMAAQGDSKAEEALLERYTRSVRMFARPYVLAGGDTEDLIQEGMMGLLSAIRSFDAAGNVPFKSYAELCIRNRIRSAVKSASRRKHLPLNSGVPLDDLLSEESMPEAFLSFDRRTTEDQVLDKENEQELQSAFAKHLSPLEQTVLSLYLTGMSYGEMAVQTGKSEKSIDNAVQRIRRKLARLPHFGDFSNS
jgi:RNA polymerase sporulation-specific sigma factor